MNPNRALPQPSPQILAHAEKLALVREKIERDTDRDFWLTAEEAKQYGVVDEIITRKPANIK